MNHHHASHVVTPSLRPRLQHRLLLLHAAGFFMIGILLIGLRIVWQPMFGEATIVYQQGESLTGRMPIWMSSKDQPQSITVSVVMVLSSTFQPRQYAVSGDDCIRSLRINGRLVTEIDGQTCSLATQTIDLLSYLRAGANTIVAEIPDTLGKQGFWMAPSESDPLMLSLTLGITVSFIVGLWLLLRSRNSDYWAYATTGIIVIGVMLRLFYFDVTTYPIRAHDADGHVDYVFSMMEKRMLPSIHEGWQTYHPPLYYIGSAVVGTFLKNLGWADWSITRGIQFMSVLLSLGMLSIVYAVGKRLFMHSSERLLWITFFSVFPGIIIFSTNINNDALAQFLSFLLCYLCLVFWQASKPQGWVGLSFVCSAALLTKSSGAVFLPIIILLLLLHPRLSLLEKWRQGAIGTLLIVSLTAWFFIHRWLEDPGATIVGNIRWLNRDLMIGNALRNYTTFLPSRILEYPFVDTFNDMSGRQFFLEHFYRTAFFGEFNLGTTLAPLATGLLLLGFCIGMLMLLGCILPERQRWKQSFPMWLIAAVLFSSHLYFRWRFPYASSQAFRYSAGLLMPVFFFVIISLQRFRGRWRYVTLALLWTFCAFCLLFDLLLIVVNPE